MENFINKIIGSRLLDEKKIGSMIFYWIFIFCNNSILTFKNYKLLNSIVINAPAILWNILHNYKYNKMYKIYTKI